MKATLYVRLTLPDGSRVMRRAEFHANGRLESQAGTYRLRHSLNGKQVWETINEDGPLPAKRRRELSLTAAAAGLAIVGDPPKNRLAVQEAVNNYLSDVGPRKSPKPPKVTATTWESYWRFAASASLMRLGGMICWVLWGTSASNGSGTVL